MKYKEYTAYDAQEHVRTVLTSAYLSFSAGNSHLNSIKQIVKEPVDLENLQAWLERAIIEVKNHFEDRG